MENVDIKTIKIEGVNVGDYPKFSDAYISSAKDLEGNEINSNELDKLTDENQAFINRFIHENLLFLGI